MKRLLAYMVARNEADRYLDACLSWARSFVDEIAFFDDNSTDQTVDVAAAHQVKVCSRGEASPSFLENESQFRSAAWEWLEDVLDPTADDWVLALDADEFLVCANGDLRSGVEGQVDLAESQGALSVRLPVPEVFEVTVASTRTWTDEFGGHTASYLTSPQVRVDGFWGKIAGTRLFRYQPHGQFSGRAMGSGAEPTYVLKGKIHESSGVHLMHYGYAWPEDREAKYQRYSSLEHGHNNAHIQSILQRPTLAPFIAVPEPMVWRGWCG